MNAADHRETLLALLRALTPGHLSTLVASVAEPGSRIGTSTDSSNFAFLRKMADAGLAEELPIGIELPPDVAGTLTSFVLNEAGRRELEGLLGALEG